MESPKYIVGDIIEFSHDGTTATLQIIKVRTDDYFFRVIKANQAWLENQKDPAYKECDKPNENWRYIDAYSCFIRHDLAELILAEI